MFPSEGMRPQNPPFFSQPILKGPIEPLSKQRVVEEGVKDARCAFARFFQRKRKMHTPKRPDQTSEIVAAVALAALVAFMWFLILTRAAR